MQIDLLVHSAGQLLTLQGGPQRGSRLGSLGLIEKGAVAIHEGRIEAVGETRAFERDFDAAQEIDAGGRVVMPGFVDPHTHLIWAGDRAVEFEMRVSGSTYLEIMEAGGGIISTVERTRAATIEELTEAARPRLRAMLRNGTTTAEAKTGYGLRTETELNLMEAILRLDSSEPIDLVPTFLGAHAIPPEYADREDDYTTLVCKEMLPELRAWWGKTAPHRRLPFVDVFCEKGAFNLDQSRRILEQARDLGFPLKIHADEFESLGGTGLAVELEASSADHLVSMRESEIQALGSSNTVAVTLPCTPFGLAEGGYTPAKALLEAGALLALATDLNPGTAWCESMQMAAAIACRYLHLTPAEAIACATINAAAAIGWQDRVGSLEAGKKADLIILGATDYRHVGYRFGANIVDRVVKEGRLVVERPEGPR